MKWLREDGIDKKLIQFYKDGGKIGGGSAGAIIFGKDIGTAALCLDKDVNNVGLTDLTGLDLCKGWDVQVHYLDSQEKEHPEYVKKTGRKLIGIGDNDAAIVSNNCKVIGNVVLIGNITKKTSTEFNFD